MEHLLTDMEEKLKTDNKYLHMENQEIKDKNHMLDTELLQTIGMVKKFQERNELLETKLDNLTEFVLINDFLFFLIYIYLLVFKMRSSFIQFICNYVT